MLTYDYFRQEAIRRFLADSGRTGRPKSIIIDGCVLTYELLVIGFATRTGDTSDAVKNKHSRLKPLARRALAAPEHEALRELILAIADVRNMAAHETVSDAVLETQFVTVWSKVRGDSAWPDSIVLRSRYCRAFFSLIAFELGRWQVSLPPSGYIIGTDVVDWNRFA